jgi:glycosyltransferase involved in cell wall biosynthesis
MGEEYVDAGHWRRESIPFRLTKRVERAAFASADGIVTLTNRIWPIISEWSGLAGRTLPHEVVPCCADLERFRFDPEARQSVRNRLGIADKLVIVYSGSIGGWYLTPEMADFFRTATEAYKDIHALWLVPSGHDLIRSLMQERGIGADRYSVISARPDEVPAYLSASDAGLAFIKPCLSKLASSPTKNAEYLACGLPLILNAGVGDSDSLITEHGAGVLITTHGSAEYLEAIGELRSTFTGLNENRSVLRNIAERLFDVRGIGIERYARLYERVFAGSVVESLPVAEISR